ncbi:hypothetical protein CAPTEDRAFT_193520 [Capitella teleta]|uniref:C-type lectin domain-containing protein n=1 Tax=Capitella teleta TaxID=283909 RepID=R7UD86_CAPTE|nr:hypothetical protein CAPTEDRAFT_193520 [Capitella teleta]|eukprot:ELU04350.1 hypothetical protein CAPTEDRAFT_193520 [Capitella teleta]
MDSLKNNEINIEFQYNHYKPYIEIGRPKLTQTDMEVLLFRLLLLTLLDISSAYRLVTWEVTEDHCLTSPILNSQTTTLFECKTACLEITDCRAAEHRSNNDLCQSSALTQWQKPSAFQPEPLCNHYEYTTLETVGSVTWRETLNTRTSGHDDAVYTEQSKEACKELCLAQTNFQCKHAEYGKTDFVSQCFLGDVSIDEMGSDAFVGNGVNVYEPIKQLFPQGLCRDETWVKRGSFCYIAECNAGSAGFARQKCSSYGATLVSIHDLHENLFIGWLGRSAMDASRFRCGISGLMYIGLGTSNNGTTWQWDDGTAFDYVIGEAERAASVMCVALNITGEAWKSIECDEHAAGFICKSGFRLGVSKCFFIVPLSINVFLHTLHSYVVFLRFELTCVFLNVHPG